MPNKAVATYLRELRRGRRLTQEQLAQMTGISKRTIERLEGTKGDIGATLHERIIAALKAVPEDVTYLVTHPDASLEEAQELAQRALHHSRDLSFSDNGIIARYRISEVAGVRTYIRLLRQYQDISRAALATEMGISVDKLTSWETGQQGTLPPEALRRAVAFLGAPFSDLERIAVTPEHSEMLALQLAEERLAKLHVEHRYIKGRGLLRDHALLGQLRAMEGLMHYMLGLLKRLLPDEADAIERTSALWFQTARARNEDEA